MLAAPVTRSEPAHIPARSEIVRILGGGLAGVLAGLTIGSLIYGSLVVGLFAAMAGAAVGLIAAARACEEPGP
jgi:hypothetical protein